MSETDKDIDQLITFGDENTCVRSEDIRQY